MRLIDADELLKGKTDHEMISTHLIFNAPTVDVLDKIRAEIDRQGKWLLQAGCTAYNVDIAFDAIKSVLAESEE